MKRFLVAGLLAGFALAGIGEVSIQPGPWNLFKGTARVATFDHEEACFEEAIKRGDGKYTCRTASAVQVSNAKTCGPDIGGWTRPVPTPVDPSIPLKDKAQPGTRLHYVSATTGNDQTGELYFWNGQAVIDSLGNTYGSDPTAPTGNVKAFKRWAWVAPRRSATVDIGGKDYPGDQWAGFRYNFPDWFLFKRGETIDLEKDFTSFAVDVPGAVVTYGTLTLSGGRSPTERQVMTAYGDPCAARPRFIHPMSGFVSRGDRDGHPPVKNVLYQSLHFDSHDRTPGRSIQGVVFNDQGPASVDILIEDVWIDGTGFAINIYNGGQFTFRRSLITDSWIDDGSHVQGFYYEGSREGVIRIEESYLMRNGFSHGDPSKTGWPPTGEQIWDLYDRNMYVNGELNPKASGLFDSVTMMGASGDQWRPGGRIHRNFIYQGYLNVGARGGYPDEDGFTGEVLGNVLQRFNGAGTNDNRGQPGWGINVGAGAGFIHVANNIVTGAQHAGKYWGVLLEPIQQDCYAPPVYPTRRNVVTKNILDSGNAPGIRVTDGTTNACFVDLIPVPGVTQNSVSENILVNSVMKEHEYVPAGNAPPTNDTAYAGNRLFKTRAEAAAAHGWKDPERTLKTYLVANGVTIQSTDGFPEYFALATQQRKGQWNPKWTARSMVNYVRDGFNLPLYPATVSKGDKP
jgi:hypothetical protein